MTQLTVVAKIKAKAGNEDLVHQELRHLIEPTLAEEGCTNYDLHCSIEDSSLFLFYENWASRDSWEKHMQSDHIKVFQSNTDGAIESWELFLLKPDEAYAASNKYLS
ncbi:MAG: putative quinol monooxygenase [Cyanobacteriota bacterium]